ncbi:MAG TPA: SusC/RagA family TonB-linked outer membrane protein [Gemmatimonadaceae bacterium]|nr:SusC/RagA family TonB-linked outer membrane protein [Gemmatimonadaceae bacterium]
MRSHRRILVPLALLAVSPLVAAAQAPITVTGRVTTESGAPLSSVAVLIPSLSVGAQTRDDGRYAFTIPAARVSGQRATITARLIGYKPLSAELVLSGGSVTQDFALEANPLQLGEIVITGAGTATEVQKLGTVRNAVSADLIQKSNESNLVSALAGKAPNVQVTSSSGEPGASSFIKIRGNRTLSGMGQPLIVVDGMPIDNSSFSTSNFNPIDELGSGQIAGTTQMNRAIDLNPDDIESLEILPGAAAGAIYGARAGQGVILVTTKKGRAGPTRTSFRSSIGLEDVSRTYPLQRSYGQGLLGVAPTSCNGATGDCLRSWGPALGPETPVYDHAREAYDRGVVSDNTLSISGGNDRTTFFMSSNYLRNSGVFVGPNNEFTRATLRLNASHHITDAFKLSGNVSYADTRGEFIHRGNNVNGLQLGLLRTPPDFNNRPYLDPETGLHRSYLVPNPDPGSARQTRVFDNPFWTLYENRNTAHVGRVFGNIGADYLVGDWLQVNYVLGADYSNDERLEGMPIGSSGEGAEGRITEGNLVNYQIDHNLTATARYTLNDRVGGTVTFGQNLNARSNRQLSVVGRTMIAPLPFKLSNTVVRDLPIDTETNVRGESYFGQATVDLYDQLYLTAALRNDGSSTFSEGHRRDWFPKASAAWTFTERLGEQPWISFGKLRAAYGEAGQEPLAYLTSPTYNGAQLLGGIVQGTGMSPTMDGFGGLATSLVKAADDLRAERTKELETGFDIGIWRDVADLSFTYYRAVTEDVILLTPLPPSSGFFVQAQNSAQFSNRGVELSLNVRPLTREGLAWDIGLQWARNRSNVDQLTAAEYILVDGTNTISPYGVAKQGLPVGVFYDYGFARCGRSPGGMSTVIAGVDLDEWCAGAPDGALFIGANGFPAGDDNLRVVGDPNPDWTGSLRSALRVRGFEFSALAEIKQGGVIYNGTRGALRSYGTHQDTEQRAICPTLTSCSGNELVFGAEGWFEGPTVGPGVGLAVPIGENWYRAGGVALGSCSFSGYSEECMEDGSYVKLREISIGYTVSPDWVARRLGLGGVELRVAGRNLHTWTKYTGYDPETNLGGALQRTRGMDYFNMPQTRAFVFTVGINR